MSSKTVVSLFSGCGGFDIGFAKQGFALQAAYDSDPLAVKCHNLNLHGTARVFDLRDEIRLQPSDVIIATPPCQGFSPIGKLHPDDERNNLLIRACQIAVQQKPKILIIENVAGLAYQSHTNIFNYALSLLTNAGYYIDTRIISCEEFGLPQRRRRLFIVARIGSRPFNLSLDQKPKRTVADAFSALPSSILDRIPELPEASKHRKIAEHIRPGQKLSNVRKSDAAVHTWDVPEVFGAVTIEERAFLSTMIKLRRTERTRKTGDADPVSMKRLETEFGPNAKCLVEALMKKSYLRQVGEKIDLRHTFNGTYRRLESDSVSPTVDTHFGNPRLFLHPTKHRGLTHIEAALLQGFDLSHEWPSAKTTAYRLIGNAVPPPIGEVFAQIAHKLL